MDQFNGTFETLDQILNSTFVSLGTIGLVYDCLIVDIYQNRPIPYIPPAIWTNMTFLMNYMDTFYYMFDVTRNLLNTLPFRKLIDTLDGVYYGTSQNPNLKWVMLSAHDTNLLIHMPFLNLSSSQCQFEKYFNGSTDALNCNNYT